MASTECVIAATLGEHLIAERIRYQLSIKPSHGTKPCSSAFDELSENINVLINSIAHKGAPRTQANMAGANTRLPSGKFTGG